MYDLKFSRGLQRIIIGKFLKLNTYFFNENGENGMTETIPCRK